MLQVHGVRLFSLRLENVLRRCNYRTVMVVGMMTAAIADILIAIAVWIMILKL